MKHCLVVFATLALLPLAAPAAESLAGKRPNIVFILTDDQGYGDLSAHGNPVLKTPNLDRLHAEGVRFTDFHVSPTCAPTRSALLTGRHEFKNGVTHTILERERLTPRATTLAQVLREAGYSTGIFGKWHLGDEPERWPSQRGFDEMFIHGAGGIGQSYPGSCGDAPGNTYFDPAILHNGKFVKTSGYCTDVFFSQAKQWIEAVKGKKPFFCVITPNAPHGPLHVRPEDEARYKDKVKQPNVAKFFGMIANIDDNVGRLLKQIEKWGLDKDTLVIFMNDNGGTAGVQVYNAGMRGQKVTPYLGGTRASSLWRWPGTLKPADCDRLAAHIDFFPTLAELAGAKLSEDVKKQIEGRSLVPLLQNPEAEWDERTLFTHVGRWPKGAKVEEHKYRGCSVRSKRWHLVSEGKGEQRWQLFDVAADPGEKTDVASKHADVVKSLDAEYDRWWASLPPYLVNEDAVGPKENPFKVLYQKQFGKVKQPNVVLFLADDLGRQDCGFMGGKEIKTPHLDKLAGKGTVLDAFYVQPVCSPTRAALMTGRYPMRHGLQVGVVRPWAQYGLPLEERTLPQAMKEAGYTTAIVGKWHLGHFAPEYLPTRRGFDRQYGHYNGALDYFTHIRDGGFDWHRDDKACRDEGYSTHLLAREAAKFVADNAGKKPFFLYVPFNAVHSPHQVPDEYMKAYPNLKGERLKYAGMLAAMDEAVGQVVAAVDKAGERDNTLFIFSSDNGGPQPGRVTDNGKYRAGKGTLYEGGVRVAAFAAWDGHIPAGKTLTEPMHVVDWYPTLLQLADARTEQKLPVDGRDAWPTLTQGKPSPHEAILLNSTPAGGAIRAGSWKLVVSNGADNPDGGAVKPADKRVELFNLKDDPYEKNNLAEKEAERVKALEAKLAAFAKQAVAPKAKPKPKDFVTPKVWGEKD